MIDPVVFREYDVRGIYGKDLTEELATLLARSLVTFLKKERGITNPTITIGHDARLSSPSLAKALAKGLVTSGAKAINLGLVTTPTSYFSTFALEGVNGALMVTGSHNPPEYNGFKISAGKSTLFGQEIQKLKNIIMDNDFITGKGSEDSFDIYPLYLKRYTEEFGKLPPIKVVVDCGNGVAGTLVRKLYSATGIDLDILFEEPDGRFPNHHPDPTVAKNLVSLIARVKETKANLGIGFDGDADRIGIVDHAGKIIDGDKFMTLISRSILQKCPGEKIIGDVKCSDRLFADIAKHGGKPIMWKTGHSLIKEKIKVEKAPFGGELSGHFFFSDRNYGFDDALYAGLRLIEVVAKTGQNIDQLLAGFPPAFNTPEIRIDTTEEKKVSIVKKLKEIYAHDTANFKVNFTDGVRISYANGWALIRSSNTQPVLVMRFESNTHAGLEKIKTEIEGIVNPLL